MVGLAKSLRGKAMALDLLVVVLLVSAIVAVVFAVQYWFGRKPDPRVQALMREKAGNSAEISSECMVREGYLEEPAVAQVANQRLSIWTVTGRSYELPLEAVKVSRIRRNNWFGRYPWWGKTLLYLDAPNTSRFMVGFDDAEPWINKLEGDSLAQGSGALAS